MTTTKSTSRHLLTYPEYKDTGIEWLGEIPEHWNLKRVKYVAKCLDGQRIPLNSEQRGQMEGNYPYWGANGIVDYVNDWLFDESLVLLGEDGAPFFECDKDVAFFVKGKIWVNNHIHVLRPEMTTEPRFLTYLLNVVDYHVFIDGSTRDKLTQGDMNSIPVQFPPKDEQSAIADFLDQETERIDGLIAKKKRQIELLGEKRAALISQAVTKGLNPNVKMKPSGIEWLGDIPEHWKVKRLKFFTNFVTSGSRGWAKYYCDNGAVFLRIGNLSRESINLRLDDIQRVNPPSGAEGERTRVLVDDLLVSVTAYIGAIGIVPKCIGEAYVNQHIAMVRFKPGAINPRWVAYCLYSWIGQVQFASLMYGGTKDGLGLDDVKNLIILEPTQGEQKKINYYLESEAQKIEDLIIKICESIDKLLEYRTALISAAVTGKIDVRQEVA